MTFASIRNFIEFSTSESETEPSSQDTKVFFT